MVSIHPNKYKQCTPTSMYKLSKRHTLLHQAEQNTFSQTVENEALSDQQWSKKQK